ncbi:MAG: hypothetical protein HKM97_09175 [Acidimicrobiia bacterium]|nr:hypothetical protein [Acidimicrobiia bacterium]
MNLVAGETSIVESKDGVDWTGLTSDPRPPTIPKAWMFGLEGRASLTSDGDNVVLAGEHTDGVWGSTDGGGSWQQGLATTRGLAMTTTDDGFVGVRFLKRGFQPAGGPSIILFSADGVNWSQQDAPTNFFDVVGTSDGVIALASDGIYYWTRPPEALAATGSEVLGWAVVGIALILGGAATLAAVASSRAQALTVPGH